MKNRWIQICMSKQYIIDNICHMLYKLFFAESSLANQWIFSVVDAVGMMLGSGEVLCTYYISI